MSIMIALVVISALTANLSIISIQGNVRDIAMKSSPLIMETEAMIARKTQACLELHSYLTENDPKKLAEIEKRYNKLIASHEHCEHNICVAIENMPCGNKTLMKTWDEGVKTITPQFDKVSKQLIATHKELLEICRRRQNTMNKQQQYEIEVLTAMQGKYADGNTPPKVKPMPTLIKQPVDLHKKQIELLEKEKRLIAAIDKLEVADFAVATKLLKLASINLAENGSKAYTRAGKISNALLVFCIFALIISVWVTMSLSKRIARPILALADAAGKIAAGDLNQKIDVCRSDEIGKLCRSFNKMSENLRGEVIVRKKAERQREKLLEIFEEKNRELQNVVYVASHDLRSPLVTINGFSEELGILCGKIENILESEDIDEGVKKKIIPLLKEGIPEDLRFITAGAEKMQMLIGGLLQISRAGTAEVEMASLDMNWMLESICQAMQYDLSSKNVSINLRDLPPCFGDASMINQVFSNLLDNAVKYRNNNGEDKIIVSGWFKSDSSVYCVEDNGIGISPDSQSKIFEIFHRLDPLGSVSGEGLGLTIISRILDRHNGKIWVESEPDQGSKFFVSIPTNAQKLSGGFDL